MASQEIITIDTNNALSLIDGQISIDDLAGQLAPSSQRIYKNDVKEFTGWLAAQGLTLHSVDRSAMIAYRGYLDTKEAMGAGREVKQGLGHAISKATKTRMFGVASRLLDEMVKRGAISVNPAGTVKNFKTGANETTHTALTKSQARDMLAAIDRTTLIGKRDYALLSLLIRNGIRRAECAAITLGDFSIRQGHHVLTIQHGKGDKRREAKIQVDVMRSISDYLEATGRKEAGKAAPLFVSIDRHGNISEHAISEKAIENIVEARARAVNVTGITPHGLRATFVTLALESGASIHQVQYAAGHSDPRTTERYQKRKLNLDDNASDYIKL